MKEKEKNLSKAKGGDARALALTKTKKIEIAKQGALARWGERITYEGILNLAGYEIPCYVTDKGTRLLSGRGMQTALRLVDDYPKSSQSTGSRLGRLFGSKALKPLILKAQEAGQFEPIKATYRGTAIHGYKTDALADLCV